MERYERVRLTNPDNPRERRRWRDGWLSSWRRRCRIWSPPQQFPSASDLYSKPVSAFVAGFIGSPAMNLLTALVVADGVRIGDDATPRLERDQLTLLHDAGLEKVTVGVRPKHLQVSDSGGIDVVVALIEDLGSEIYLDTHVMPCHAGPDVQTVARALSRGPVELADSVELRKTPEGVVICGSYGDGERL